MVVEDEPLVRWDLVEELAARGFRVLEAGSGAEALSLLESHGPMDVLSTDVDMPGGMDGLALASIVSERWSDTRIMVTSGYRKVTLDQMPLHAHFVSKPYLVDSICVILQSVANMTFDERLERDAG